MDKDGMSLKEFVENNHKLLSTVAIFATITTLINNLPIKWMSVALSFISIAGMVVVWHEIKTQLPEKMSPRLFIFRYILLWGFGGLVFYWILEFREIWHYFLFAPLSALFMYITIQTLNPLTNQPVVKKIFGIGGSKTWLQKILKVVVLLSIVFVSLYFATLFSIPLNLIFDVIKNNFR